MVVAAIQRLGIGDGRNLGASNIPYYTEMARREMILTTSIFYIK
jgi:hypothetical protein